MPQVPDKYVIGVDFSQEQYQHWLEQLTWWIGDRHPRVQDPRGKAENILEAARYGKKLNGDVWVNMPQDFFKRVSALSGFDVKHGIGIRDPKKRRPITRNDFVKEAARDPAADMPPIDLTKALELRADYIKNLLEKYPHLDTPVYKPKVDELAETIVKSRMISNDFIAARGKQLETLSKVRESLHKQIGELMEFLEISPKQRVTKTLDAKNADVGSLISRLESYGEVWKEYEKLDALRELLQLYRMLKNTRPDGTPQLNDWEIWHMTRNRPIVFTCRHGESYELLGGFTTEEIEQALLQAQKVYGYGLEAIDKDSTITKTIDSIALAETFDEPIPFNNETNDDI